MAFYQIWKVCVTSIVKAQTHTSQLFNEAEYDLNGIQAVID